MFVCLNLEARLAVNDDSCVCVVYPIIYGLTSQNSLLMHTDEVQQKIYGNFCFCFVRSFIKLDTIELWIDQLKAMSWKKFCVQVYKNLLVSENGIWGFEIIMKIAITLD